MIYGSVCSGVESASLAWAPLGWRASFVSEIEKFPRAVLEQRLGVVPWERSRSPAERSRCAVPLRGDFTEIEAREHEPIDLLVGGTPCQSFSVAGRRLGLDDARGNLAIEYLRLARRLQPRWLVFENVPGLLSCGEGRDFGTFLGLLGQCGYGFAYRVLDAQYVRVDGLERAVPQRRRRLFVVGHLGDWRPAAAVLFEPEGLRGDPAPGREAGEKITGPVTSSADTSRKHGHGWGQQEWESGFAIPVAKPLGSHKDCGWRGDLDGDTHVPVAFGGNDTRGPIEVATACRAKGGSGHGDFESETFVAHTLRGEGFDASCDGSGKGTPLVPVLAFSCKDHGADADEGRSPTLRAMGHDGSHANAGGQVAVAFDMRGREGGSQFEGPHDTANVRAASGGPSRSYVAETYSVRRLTPRECERLQGMPDDWTRVAWRGKAAALCPDGPRYKAIGNAMAVNCMRWIGTQIAAVEEVIAP